jgi:galactokinase
MEKLIEKVRDGFRENFEGTPRVFRAPGRVNLIGEHTDYNEGFVLPFAIDRESAVAGTPRLDSLVNVVALDPGESFAFDLTGPPVKRRGSWKDYIEGTARSLCDGFGRIKGANLVFSSSVPIGAGLSSSAAIEISAGFALLALNGIEVDRKKLAFAGQKAEHEYVGTRSGIMDQFTSALAKGDNALLLDCRSLEVKYIPLNIPGTMLAVCDTKVKHELSSSEYNTRRKECEAGVDILRLEDENVSSLRDVTEGQLEAARGRMPETVYRRCRHVITENIRTLAAADSLGKQDPERVGELMFMSHASLKDDYEVSCAELDVLVEIAGSANGVFGARMTGGGFGGCTVNLLRSDALVEFREAVRSGYRMRFGFEPDVYVFEAAEGAGEID